VYKTTELVARCVTLLVVPEAQRFGRYRVIGTLGSGAMGKVFVAVDDVLGREVAIKVLHGGADGRAAGLLDERFRIEARAIAQLAHPNVVQVFDLALDADPPYLVMERVVGPSLMERLVGQPLTDRELRALGIQIANALGAAHAAGIVHRDVKPSNILFAGEGTWKLADFGVARLPDSSLTLSGRFVGSPAYAAPEALLRGKSSPAGDVYGLSATLYQALAGRWPRAEEACDALLAPVPPLAQLAPHVSPVVAEVIDRGLATEPDQRPSARALASALASATTPIHGAPQASMTPVATEYVASTPGSKPAEARTSRKKIVIATVGLAIALGGAVIAARRATTGTGKGVGSGANEKPASIKTDAGATGSDTSPEDYARHMSAGDAFAKKRQWEQALSEFEAALRARPGDFEALAEVGWCAVWAGRTDRAREASIAAAEAAPAPAKKAMALYNLGLAFESYDGRAALALYDESLRLRPNETVARSRAKVLRRIGSGVETAEGTAALSRLRIPTKTVDDAALIAALQEAGCGWNAGAGHSGIGASLTCTANGDFATCTGHDLMDEGHAVTLTGLSAALVLRRSGEGRRIEIRCSRANEGFEPGHFPPDSCSP
jgi:serine/threonine-protein kinase